MPLLSRAHAGRNGSDAGARPDLLRLADQCVKCGYCLPHCPTFRLRQDEAESPRGRIALIQGWLGGQIPYDARVDAHLANCLECRACEPVCPSLVRFGALMDGARGERERRRPRAARWLARLRLRLLSGPGWLPALALAAALARGLRVHRLGRRASGTTQARLRILGGVLAALHRPRSRRGLLRSARPPARPAAHTGAAAQVALFRGCVARAVQGPTEAAALRVLRRLGWAVALPAGQGCCGAMHRHNGERALAERALEHNRRCFGALPVVGFASACTGELAEHGGLDATELCRWLAEHPWPADAVPRRLDARVAVHVPCSQRNLLGDPTAAYRLLERIPGLETRPLAENALCCGAAGTYLLEHPRTALALAAPKIAALQALRPRFLVTTNTGCALHLAARIDEAGLDIEVLHPVELLDRQLRAD